MSFILNNNYFTNLSFLNFNQLFIFKDLFLVFNIYIESFDIIWFRCFYNKFLLQFFSYNLFYSFYVDDYLLEYFFSEKVKYLFLITIFFENFDFYMTLNHYLNLNISLQYLFSVNNLNFIIFLNILKFIFYFLFFILLINSLLNIHTNIIESEKTLILLIYEIFIFFWINFTFIKFESYEEAICSLILWPWLIFLVFTHLISFDNNEFFFIFIEWGLPVIYGYILIIENIWLFSTFFFVYLNGTKSKKILIFTLIEDIISFFILIARITLQIIRGIICGFYHDFFKELAEVIVDFWESFFWFNKWNIPFFSNKMFLIFFFFLTWYIISFILLFIYLILFLQLLFLLIAVWLFARCWFITHKNFNFNFKNV